MNKLKKIILGNGIGIMTLFYILQVFLFIDAVVISGDVFRCLVSGFFLSMAANQLGETKGKRDGRNEVNKVVLPVLTEAKLEMARLEKEIEGHKIQIHNMNKLADKIQKDFQ